MRTKFVVCENTGTGDTGAYAMSGEPVIPNFPTGPTNTFLGVDTFKPCYYARVAVIARTLEELLDSLKREYPCLPDAMLTEYLVATSVEVADMPEGSILQLYSTYDIYKLVEKETGVMHVLWTRQPVDGNDGD